MTRSVRVRLSAACVGAVTLVLAAACGDPGISTSGLTLPPLTTGVSVTGSSAAPSSTASTTTRTTTTTTTTSTTTTTLAPTTTRPRATDATAQGFYEGWVANDATKMATYGEPAAIAQATTLGAANRARPWNFERCEGAAGSIYCSWLDGSQRLIIRVRNVEPPPRLVAEVRIDAV